jgi:murein L,D-transpeptidase YcbB/YkuD
LQRLEGVQFDGLNPDDYPVDTLIDVRDGIDPNDAVGAAREELYYSVFFVAYAGDLKIGRIAPRKVNPNLFHNRNTIDVLHLLTDLKKQRDPRKFLSALETHKEHCQMLKRIMLAYVGMTEQGGWPVLQQGPVVKPGMTDPPRVPKMVVAVSHRGS